jgi:NTE family protein
MLALALSGGGLFGAWQVGAWSVLAGRVSPQLIVGASIGSLNGYLIASGASPEELRRIWLDPKLARFRDLPGKLRWLTSQYAPRSSDGIRYAITVTDLLRMKPRIFQGSEITWRHLAASCAVPVVLPQVRIGGRIYSDGGLLNPLPAWAAAELGAKRIIGLHALPESPLGTRMLVRAFRGVAGHHPPLPAGVALQVISPGRALGSLRDALYWKRENIERWLAQGAEDAARLVT